MRRQILIVENATLRIASNDPDEGTKDIPLTGFSTAPDIQLSATSHNYGNVDMGSFADWVLVIHNVGNQDLTVSNISSNNGDFEITSPASFPVVVSASGNIDVTIRFTPSAGGTRTATVTISSEDILYTMSLLLSQPRLASLATSSSAGTVPRPNASISSVPMRKPSIEVCASIPPRAAASKAV